MSQATSFGISAMMDSTSNIIHELSSCKYLTSVDLTKAYFALPASKELIDSGYNNFVCHRGSFSLLTALTGHKNTPFFLQQIIQKFLNNDNQGNFDPITSSKIKVFYDCGFHIILFSEVRHAIIPI